MKKNCTPNLKLTFAQGKTSRSGQFADPAADPLPIHDGEIHAHWQETATRKGFDITGRILDRYHLALRCHSCGHSHASRIYTLTQAQPQCPACLLARLEAEAEAAGLIHLGRDPGARHYSRYRADCGHVIRRQHEMIRRMAAGETGFRCETCHAALERAEARRRGWILVGPDPQGHPTYRLYRHGCGHVQRVARANMQSGRFDCAGCGQGWAAAPSYLYAMRFTLENGRELVKLGYSRDPESRLTHQLLIDRRIPARILRVVPVPTGHQAICIEKGLHSNLRREHPEAVVDPACWRGRIRVGSEIYDARLTPRILTHLARIEAERPGDTVA